MKRKTSTVHRNDIYKRIKLASPVKSDSSDTESILSIQNYSTEAAIDTEDTSDSYVNDEEMERCKRQRKYLLSTSEESEIQVLMCE